MSSKSISLTKHIAGHAGPITSVILREPSGADFLELGDPRTWVRTKDGAVVAADNDGVIQHYVRRALDPAVADLVIHNAALADMIRIREAVLDFFIDAHLKAAQARGDAKPAMPPS